MVQPCALLYDHSPSHAWGAIPILSNLPPIPSPLNTFGQNLALVVTVTCMQPYNVIWCSACWTFVLLLVWKKTGFSSCCLVGRSRGIFGSTLISSEALDQLPRGTWILRLSSEQRWNMDLALDYYSGWNPCCRDCFGFFLFFFNQRIRQAVCDSQLQTEFCL